MPNDDYIKRSDALKAILWLSIYDTLVELDGARTIGENTWADGIYDAYKVIEEEVDEVVVDPTQRWIPVTERLPEVDKQVLVYAVGKIDGFIGDSVIAISERMILRLAPWCNGEETWSPPWQYFLTDYEITHWMPLPSTEGLK